ncbi:uncharacterized protein LOC112180871 isoform X1 [Rosa chinensis]|uniref:uncharacterized protein LOC112180871 isoform X1 n=1 Tax=Rosa chinensis TaxID=74649 RepID=UPI000D08D43A|nr:uncharacterized protein LOC112180871 isoform X1 [Rosa chinensis]
MQIDQSAPSCNETSFSALFHEKREKKLQDAWPMLESSFEEFGVSCALNLAERSVIVSTTGRTKGRNSFDKATRIVELLATTHVPPYLAIEILNGDRKHILIKTGNQQGGLCSIYGIKKDQFVKQRECLACSLEALGALTFCYLFLNEDTVAAVGDPLALMAIRKLVVGCIVNNADPATTISEVKTVLRRRQGVENLQHPNVDYLRMENSGPSLDLYGMLEVTSFSMTCYIGREKVVQEALPFLQSFLEEYGISCTLNMAERSMTLSTTRRTKDPDVMDKAVILVELLARTSIPASKAIEILHSRLQHEVIKTGFQEGGLCSKYGIKKERFVKNKDRFKCYLQTLARLSKCEIYINESSVVAVGTSGAGLRQFRSIVECCFIKDEDPACIVRRLKLNGETYRLMKKLEALCL